MKSLLEFDWRCIGRSSGIDARMIGTAALFLLGALGATTVAAQVASPVRLIVPFATGGPTDIGARVIAPYLTDHDGAPVHLSELWSDFPNPRNRRHVWSHSNAV